MAKHKGKHSRALKLAMKGGAGHDEDPGSRLASGKHARTARGKRRKGGRRHRR